MSRSLPNRRTGLVLGLYGVVCLLLIVGIDASVRLVLDRLQERTLTADAIDAARLEQTLVDLQAEVDQLQTQSRIASDRHVPSIEELKQLSVAHDLRLTRMERQQAGGATRQGVRYVTTFRGGMADIVRFLRALEEQHLCSGERVELWPADESGAAVFVQLSLSVGER